MSDVDVLIVDDDVDLLTVAQLMIEDLGYKVGTARNGREGYARAIELHPRLVLTDLMMPLMRGDRLLATLRDNPDTAGIPCVLMTSAPGQIQGFDGHLITKPFSLNDLEVMVHHFMDNPGTRAG